MNTNDKSMTDEKALLDYLGSHPDKPNGIDEISIEGSTSTSKLRQERTSVPRAKRVHVKEMDREDDGMGGFRAKNGGLYEIVVHKDESVGVVPSRCSAGTVEDLRLLRNLITDLDGYVSICKDYRLAFWKWMAAVIQRIFEHPAMQADAEPMVVPHFDSLQWEEDFLSGMTVDQAVEKADAKFNLSGW